MSAVMDEQKTMDTAREVLQERIRAREANRSPKRQWIAINSGVTVVVENIISTADTDTVVYRLVGTSVTRRCTPKQFLALYVRPA